MLLAEVAVITLVVSVLVPLAAFPVTVNDSVRDTTCVSLAAPLVHTIQFGFSCVQGPGKRDNVNPSAVAVPAYEHEAIVDETALPDCVTCIGN
jgi:hypothetical protein